MTIEQKLNRYMTNLYLERAKTRNLRKDLEQERKNRLDDKNFINQLVIENSQLQKRIIELEYIMKGDTKDV